jgi:hypothetical protein
MPIMTIHTLSPDLVEKHGWAFVCWNRHRDAKLAELKLIDEDEAKRLDEERNRDGVTIEDILNWLEERGLSIRG